MEGDRGGGLCGYDSRGLFPHPLSTSAKRPWKKEDADTDVLWKFYSCCCSSPPADRGRTVNMTAALSFSMLCYTRSISFPVIFPSDISLVYRLGFVHMSLLAAWETGSVIERVCVCVALASGWLHGCSYQGSTDLPQRSGSVCVCVCVRAFA